MKYLCILAAACLFVFPSAPQGKYHPTVEKAKEYILMRNAQALKPLLAPQFELQIDQQRYGLASGHALGRLQQFMDRFPCTSIQLASSSGNQVAGSYASRNGNFHIRFTLSADKIRLLQLRAK